MTLFSLPCSTLSLFMRGLGRLFCPKRYVGGRYFLQVQENRPNIVFREVKSTHKVYGKEWRISWARNFSGFLRNTQKIFVSFTGPFSGPRSFRVFWETHACTRCHKWAKFVVGSHPQSEDCSPGSQVFLPPQQTTIYSKFQFNQEFEGHGFVRCKTFVCYPC